MLATNVVHFFVAYFFARSDESESGFSAVVSSEESVDSSSLFDVSEDDGVSDDGDVPVDVDTEIKLDDIAVLHDDVLLDRSKRSVVADAVVDIGLRREGNALRHFLLFFVDFVSLLDDQVVAILADLESGGADLGFLNQSCEDSKISMS